MSKRASISLMIFAIIIFFTLLAMLVSSCGSGYHLRRAKLHMMKAEAKGAQVNRRTIIEPVKFIAPKMEFTTKLADINVLFKDTFKIVNEAGQEVKARIDTVTQIVTIECPQQEVEKDVTVRTETDIEAPRGFLYYFGVLLPVILLIFIVGVFIGLKFRALFKPI